MYVDENSNDTAPVTPIPEPTPPETAATTAEFPPVAAQPVAPAAPIAAAAAPVVVGHDAALRSKNARIVLAVVAGILLLAVVFLGGVAAGRHSGRGDFGGRGGFGAQGMMRGAPGIQGQQGWQGWQDQQNEQGWQDQQSVPNPHGGQGFGGGGRMGRDGSRSWGTTQTPQPNTAPSTQY